MKQVSAILLSIVLVVHLVFTYGAYGILRFQAREATEQKMMQTLPDNELALVVVHPGNKNEISFSWFGDDEFRYKNHMYDVVRKRVNGDTTSYYCLDDTREAELVDKMDKHIADAAQNGQVPGTNNDLLKTAHKEYIVPYSIVFNDFYKSFTFAETTQSLSETSFSEIPAPPPRG